MTDQNEHVYVTKKTIARLNNNNFVKDEILKEVLSEGTVSFI